MCGRYNLSSPPDLVARLFHATNLFEWSPRYNIAPTQLAPVVRMSEGPTTSERRIDLLRWGLVPNWAKDETIGNRLINARAESAAEKPAFRKAFRSRRCVIPADGFYEWKETAGKKQPYYIHSASNVPFAFAGLWERWEKGAEPLETFTILTTDASSSIRAIHDRMPVILPTEEAVTRWLDPAHDALEDLALLLAAAPDDMLEAMPISTYVNSPRNEGPECIEPADAPNAQASPASAAEPGLWDQ